MKQIIISGKDTLMLNLVKLSLQEGYRLSLLTETELPGMKSYQADLFLLSLTQENRSSLSEYDRIKSNSELTEIPVIFFANPCNSELERQAIMLGAQEVISIPIAPELLRHRIGECLELVELRKQKPFTERYQDAISDSFAELVECRDITTGGHMKNTRRYFQILLEEVMNSAQYKDRITPEDTRDLLRSVTLHDIGKIGINDEILRKASVLDYKEFEYMKTHTLLGKETIDKIIKETGGTKWLYLARDMAYSHHERWDGTGYPEGLKGEDIPLYARMLTIVDVYDALTSNRSYKEAYSHGKAFEIIRSGQGSYFDPDLVDLFIQADRKFEDALNKM